MDFRIDPDDRQAIDAARDVIAHAFGPGRLRDADPRIDAWARIASDGWLHACLPEDQGGQDVPLYLTCAFARESGRALCVDEWTNNAFVIPRLISLITDGPTRMSWLERHRAHPGTLIVDGRSPSLATSSATSAVWCFGAQTGSDGYAVELAGGRASLVRVCDPVLRRVDLAPGVAEVSLAGGVRGSADLSAADDVTRVGALAPLVHAAALVGLAEASERITVDHVKIREQFGQPVGRFQAVKHALADVHVQNEIAWNACLYAALRPDEPGAIDVARVQAVEASLHATKAAVQLHGGIGFTWESDVHFYLKLALVGGQRFGGRDRRAAEIGRALVTSAWS